MTNLMKSESKLKLPTCYVEVTDNEMEYLDGGGWISFSKIAGSIVMGLGLATAVVGVAISLATASPIGVRIVACGLLATIVGGYILASGGHVDIEDMYFPSL